MSEISKKEYVVLKKRPYVPTWVGWLSVGLYAIIFLSVLYSLYKGISSQFDIALLITLLVSIFSVGLCLYFSSHFEWEIRRTFERHESGYFHYTYFTPLALMGSGKFEVKIKEIDKVIKSEKSVLITGVLYITESPTKPKPINSFKLRLDFENNNEVLEDLECSIKNNREE